MKTSTIDDFLTATHKDFQGSTNQTGDFMELHRDKVGTIMKLRDLDECFRERAAHESTRTLLPAMALRSTPLTTLTFDPKLAAVHKQ